MTLSFEAAGASVQKLHGALTFATAAAGYETGRRCLSALSAGTQVHFDCGGLAEADSAGLAVLIEWKAEAKRRAIALHYSNLPVSVGGLAGISGVEALLAGG